MIDIKFYFFSFKIYKHYFKLCFKYYDNYLPCYFNFSKPYNITL